MRGQRAGRAFALGQAAGSDESGDGLSRRLHGSVPLVAITGQVPQAMIGGARFRNGIMG